MPIKTELEDLSPVFCTKFYDYGAPSKLLIITVLAVVPALNLFSAWKIYQNRRGIPIRQRAPLIAILLLMLQFFNFLWELWFEFLIRYKYLSSWEGVKTEDGIPFTRKLCKFFLIFMRLSISYVTACRTFIIWCGWNRTGYKGGLLSKVIHFFCDERKAALSMTIGLFLWSGAFYGDVGYLANIENGLDWYCPWKTIGHVIWSTTTARIIEMFTCLISLNLIRNFPSGFNIKQELLFIGSMWFASDHYFELRLYKSELGRAECSIFEIRLPLIIIAARTVLLSIAFLYFCQIRDVSPPAPSMPSNFVEFIQIPQYRTAFLKFLKFRGQDHLLEVFHNQKSNLLINYSFDEDQYTDPKGQNEVSIIQEHFKRTEPVSVRSDFLSSEHGRDTLIDEIPKMVEEFEEDYYLYRQTKSFSTVKQHLELEARAFYMGIDSYRK